MADETDQSQKTEDPTAKRLEEAHRKGQVAKSDEVGHWFVLSGATLVVLIFAGGLARDVAAALLPFLERPHGMPAEALDLRRDFGAVGLALLKAAAAPMALLFCAAALGPFVQHRPVLSAERLKPDFARLSPLKGLKRMFGPQSWLILAKAVLKIALVGGAALLAVWPELRRIELLTTVDLLGLLDVLSRVVLLLAAGALAMLAAIAVGDLFYQKWDFLKNQRMSKQEVKEEHKQTEGDPQVKARIRQLRMERSRKRMMAAVPTASVVVTNPTHFAVALRYEQAAMAAPKVVAKGMDLLALRIRELAAEHGVPVVENPPLARALHAGVELDREIPPEFYKAVAEIIGYVMRLQGRLPPRRG
jgi:flagellar biosynthesis protein FlhB